MSKKSKKEEALAFLDDLDKLGDDAPLPPPSDASRPSFSAEKKAQQTGGTPKASVDLPRKSVDSSRSSGKAVDSEPTSKPLGDDDPEAALAYLQAQIDQKRPASRVSTPVARPSTPLASSSAATIGSVLSAPTGDRRSIDQNRKSHDGGPRDGNAGIPSNQPTSSSQIASEGTSPSSAGGWGFKPSFWSSAIQTARSTASSAITQASQIASTAQSAAIAQAEKNGVNVELAGVDLRGLKLDDLRKAGAGGLEALRARVGEGVKGVDLEKLRQELLSQTSQAFTELINTVAPPISEHEVLQVWLTYPLVGYEGVKDVVFAAIEQIMLQTSSSELEVFFISVDSSTKGEERSINPVDGWEKAWTKVRTEIEVLKTRAKTDERRGTPNPDLPVTTIPLHLHLQPVLAPLPYPEISKAETQPKHLWFIVTIHDDVHSLRNSTVTQSVPADWLDVEYEKSDWVEERLVDILRNGTMIAMQEYVAVRMNLKASLNPEGTADASVGTGAGAMPSHNDEKEMEVARESGGGH